MIEEFHSYIDQYCHLLDNKNPLVSPPCHAHISNSTPFDIISDDDVQTLSAFLGNIGCSDKQVNQFEGFAGQQQRLSSC